MCSMARKCLCAMARTRARGYVCSISRKCLCAMEHDDDDNAINVLRSNIICNCYRYHYNDRLCDDSGVVGYILEHILHYSGSTLLRHRNDYFIHLH